MVRVDSPVGAVSEFVLFCFADMYVPVTVLGMLVGVRAVYVLVYEWRSREV